MISRERHVELADRKQIVRMLQHVESPEIINQIWWWLFG